MTFETFLVVMSPFFVHASIVFLQSFWKGPSQYDDLLDVQINRLSSTMNVQQLFDVQLAGKFDCKELLASVLVWNSRLRQIGFIPILLYISIFFLLLAEFAINEQVNVKLLSNVLIGAAVSLQLLYVILKIYSNIPELLMHLHRDYKNSSFVLILLDIVPLWRR